MKPTKRLGAMCIVVGLAGAFVGVWAAVVPFNLGRRDVAGEAFLVPGLTLFWGGIIMTWVKRPVVRVADCIVAGAALSVASWLLLALESALGVKDGSAADLWFTLLSIGLLLAGILLWNRVMERRARDATTMLRHGLTPAGPGPRK